MNIEKAAEEAVSQLLPSKSGHLYEKQYVEFKKWCEEQSANDFTEEKVLLAYFFEKSKKLKASSLWSQYSMIKAMMIREANIDISKYNKLHS